nr:hypothetical protein MFLOJ_08340 [Mycobacterium florentinum]
MDLKVRRIRRAATTMTKLIANLPIATRLVRFRQVDGAEPARRPT